MSKHPYPPQQAAQAPPPQYTQQPPPPQYTQQPQAQAQPPQVGNPIRYGCGHTIGAPLGMGQRAPFLTAPVGFKGHALHAKTESVNFNYSQFVFTPVMASNQQIVTSGDVVTIWNQKRVLGCVMEKKGMFSSTMVPKQSWYTENMVAEHCRYVIFSRQQFQQSITAGELANVIGPYQSNQIVPGHPISLGEPIIFVPLSAPNCILIPEAFNASKPNPDTKGVIHAVDPSTEPFFAGFNIFSIPVAPSTTVYIPGSTVSYSSDAAAIGATVGVAAVNAAIAVGTGTAQVLNAGFNALMRPRPTVRTTSTTTVIRR